MTNATKTTPNTQDIKKVRQAFHELFCVGEHDKIDGQILLAKEAMDAFDRIIGKQRS